MNLQEWTDTVADALGIEVDFDVRTILDTARDVAHAVERPAAPVAAFMVGYAAAVRGGTEDDIESVAEMVSNLAKREAVDVEDVEVEIEE